MNVTLQPITQSTLRQVLALSVSPEQANYVAGNAVSLAQALFHPEAWYRAICLDAAPAGFVMLEDPLLLPVPPEKPEPSLWLWRFMIDRQFQGRGIGKRALGLVVDHARRRGAYSRSSRPMSRARTARKVSTGASASGIPGEWTGARWCSRFPCDPWTGSST